MFDVASQRHRSVLGCYTPTAMGLIAINEGQFERVASASSDKPVDTVKSKEDFIAEYPMAFNSSVGTLEGPVDIQVDRSVVPTALSARTIPAALRETVKAELERLRKLKVIEFVTKPTDWVSQMVTVQKKDGSVRLCIDPRLLNEALFLKRERYHLPTFDEAIPEMAGAKVSSKLDLRAGFWHVVFTEQASDLTALQTPYGRFKWKRLPFGLCVSSEIFQRKVHEAFDGLQGVKCITGDVVVTGSGQNVDAATKEHDPNLQAFLKRCVHGERCCAQPAEI